MEVNNSIDNFDAEGKLFNHIDSMYNQPKGFDRYWQNRRKHLVLQEMNNLFVKCTSNSLLDIGCAEGLFTEKAETYGYNLVVGIELSKVKLLRASKHAKIRKLDIYYVQCSAERLPFINESFDLILMSRVLELIPDEIKSLIEVKRTAKHFFILTVPSIHATLITLAKACINPKNIIITYSWGTQARLYARHNLNKRLKKDWKINKSFGVAPISHVFIDLFKNKELLKMDNQFENKFLFRMFGHDIFYLMLKE